MTAATDRKTKARGNGQGTVWEVRKGLHRWQVTLGYKPDGKRLTASGKAASKSAAQAAMTQALADHARGLLAAPDSTTLAEYAETWLGRQKQVRERSVDLYRQELSYALAHIGKMRVRDVRARHLKDLMVALSEQEMKGGRGLNKPMAQRTQAKVLTRLRALFREAVSDQLIHVSPVEGVKKVKAPSPEAVGRVLDLPEAARFQELGAALHAAGLCRLWPALFTAVSVGLRRGEVMGLAWDCVDLERGVLMVRRSLRGKGKAELGDVKTRASRRDIHMPASLIAALKAHKERQAEERAAWGAAWRDTGAVFATAEGEWTHPDNLNRAIQGLLDWSDPDLLKEQEGKPDVWRGIPRDQRAALMAVIEAGQKLPDLSPHDLRHTYATLALRRRVPVEVVSKTLGHARVSITLDIYRHVLDSERKEYVIDLFSAPVPVRQGVASLPN